MKILVPANSVSTFPVTGEYLFIESATSEVEVTWQTDNGAVTGRLQQGATIHMMYTSLSFNGLGVAQEIEIRAGFGQYTPPITAVTSTIIDQIKKPIAVSSIEQALKLDTVTTPLNVASIAEPVAVASIAEPVAVSAIAEPVAVAAIAEPVAVAAIAEPVAVASIAEPVVVAGVASVVEVEAVSPVEVVDQTGTAFKSNDYVVLAGSFIDVPARDRSQIIFQSVGENETRCRVSDTDAQAPEGMWLIGGGSLFGESPILRTKAALRVWNTSSSDAVITVNEVY
ncbi:hypothetical protein [Marinomonas fungiae]|uniref:hypothetical protein n=1 Tax=Marinomonas fungiae TaxID=1137284 RepID=UPI003A93679D